MNVKVNNISFRAYTPVKFFIKDSKKGQYYPVADSQNAKSCNRTLVNNLNSKPDNKKMIDYYSSFDKDYEKQHHIHTFFDYPSSNIYLFSGDDAYILDEQGKNIGIAKAKSKKLFGHTKSYEVRQAVNNYQYFVRNYKKDCSAVKDLKNNPVTLTAYFDKKYNKKGNETGMELKGIEFVQNVDYTPTSTPNLSMCPQQPEYEQMSIFDLIDKK